MALLCLLSMQELGAAQRSNAATSQPSTATNAYMGREIATTMHYQGAPWLVRETREREERCSLMLTQLGLKRGTVVCDLGCGNGYHTIPMAKLVGPRGYVLAVDIQPEMLKLLEDRMTRERVTNIRSQLGRVNDPQLPAAAIDLVLLVDVYHEFSDPQRMLAAIRKSLTANGQVALLEYRAEDPRVPIRPLHKMSKSQIMQEFTVNGFKLVREFNSLPWQHMMFFARSDSSLPAIEPKSFKP